KAEKEACEGEIGLVGPVETDALGKRILVVEDKADVRRLAMRMLTRLGYDVLEAADGKTALERLDANPKVDLLFTDIILPGRISGADLAKAALARYPELKVLYTTGYANNSAFGNDSAQGTIRVIKKPYAKENLARMVRQVLASAPRETSSRGQRSARA
ncbi:MAG: response regulator, partial [Burkholderiales bacterium]|nr:response regulator [Burkholderiales bacterium]